MCHVIKHHIELLIGEDLGVGLGLFKKFTHNICDFLGCYAKIRSNLFHTILY